MVIKTSVSKGDAEAMKKQLEAGGGRLMPEFRGVGFNPNPHLVWAVDVGGPVWVVRF